MTTQYLVAILGSLGIGAVLAAIVTGLFSRRKLSADAAEIITKAAAGVVTNMQAEIDRQVRRNHELITEHEGFITRLMESHTAEIEEFRRVLHLHVAWDSIAIAEMAKIGIELPPAPPLLPTRQFNHPRH